MVEEGALTMYLKREIYNRLLDWKNDSSHSALEINGARQVGKTYIINKFADENFRRKIYINLFERSGKDFMKCFQKATDWTPGTPRNPHPLHDAFRFFEPSFEDTDDTVIIIDEIQESSEIFNCIREFTRQFQARFVVTGSYLGRVLEPEFRFSSGDVTTIRIFTLSFQEFPEEIIFETPAFATYRGGEIDFVAQSARSSARYLIEVKSGKGTAATAQKALAQGKAQKLLYLKGDTKGSRNGNIETLPIYMLERYQFL